jgi:hypothetical protein
MQTRFPGHRRQRAVTVLVVLAAAAMAAPAQACSTCKCGDYTITLLGSEKTYDGRFRAGLEALWRTEAQGEPGVDERETTEQRATLGLAYSLSAGWTVAAQVPFVRKRIEDANLARQEAEGLGDIDLLARWTLLRVGESSLRHVAGLRLGLRLPTTEQIRDRSGERLDIDVQPDAGATAPNLGGWYSYFRFPWFVSASATYFRFGDGHQGFAPGNALVGSVVGQYALTPMAALQLGLDARHAQANRFSRIEDPDSGGVLAMGFAGLALRFYEDVVVNAGVQLPLIENLHGFQDEHAAYRVGLTYDF